MKELLESLTPIIEDEIKRGNAKNPEIYNSYHEGYSFINEEVEEAELELKHILTQIERLWICVKNDNIQRSLDRALLIKKHALNLAGEAIQIVVTSEKYLNSFDKENKESEAI